MDNAGNVYISDYYSQRVRRVDTTGTITTIAGSGEPGYGGDDGTAAEARLFFPWGVAADHAGNLYITDSWQPPRPADRYYGGPSPPSQGRGGRASTRMLAWRSRRHWPSPTGVAVDGSGNLYFSGPFNFPILRVDATGTMSEVAGTREPYDGPDDERRLIPGQRHSGGRCRQRLHRQYRQQLYPPGGCHGDGERHRGDPTQSRLRRGRRPRRSRHNCPILRT